MWHISSFYNNVSAVQQRAPWSSSSCCEFVWEHWRLSNFHTKALHDSDFSLFSLSLISSRWLSRRHPSLACSSCFLSLLFFLLSSHLASLPSSLFLSHSSSPLAGLLWFHLSCLTCSCRPYKLTCLPSLWTLALVGRPNNTIIFCTNYLTPTTGSISQLFSPHTGTHTHTHTHKHTHKLALDRLLVQMQCRSTCIHAGLIYIYWLHTNMDAECTTVVSNVTCIFTYIRKCTHYRVMLPCAHLCFSVFAAFFAHRNL